MLKLYKSTPSQTLYWETWDDGKRHTVHWGVLGTKGESREHRSTLFSNARKIIQKEIDQRIADGYAPIDEEDHRILLVEFPIDGMGNAEDLAKRHALEGWLNETLGWHGLGHCDGGSTGSGTMEACCLVVDFAIAKAVLEQSLKGTEFGDYSRIYDEDAE